MRGTSKRGSFRGGGFKKSFSKKRSSPDDDDAVPQVSKKARGGGNDEAAALVPELQTDDDNNPFVAVSGAVSRVEWKAVELVNWLTVGQLKANGTRRVTISDFKGKTLVSIREYYVDDGGDMRPGKKVRCPGLRFCGAMDAD